MLHWRRYFSDKEAMQAVSLLTQHFVFYSLGDALEGEK
jgi:hypothetical protein